MTARTLLPEDPGSLHAVQAVSDAPAHAAPAAPEPPAAVEEAGTVTAGTTSDTLRRLRDRYVPKAISQVTTVAVASAQGAWLTDFEGRRYLDFAAGIGVLNLGHNHPEVLAAAREQLERFSHLSFHLVLYEGYVRLAQALDRIFPAPFPTKSLLFNSGAEAVENAIKIARAATGREYVISFQNGFHGRTYGALAATGKTKPARQPFLRSMVPNVLHVPFPYPYRPLADLPAEQLGAFYVGLLERTLETQVAPEEVAAIIAEPVQGEGGFVVPPPDYFPRLRRLCDRHGILLLADEVQTGFGRTGRLFGLEHWGVAPDLMATSKALGAGLPLGAVTGRAEVMDRLPEASVGSTYGGNPVACAAALKTIEIIERDGIPARAARIGERIAGRLQALAARYECIGEARGLGAMQAVELVTDRTTKEPDAALVEAVSREAYERGLITNRAGLYSNVIRTLTPLTITDSELDQGLDILEASLAAALDARARGGSVETSASRSG